MCLVAVRNGRPERDILMKRQPPAKFKRQQNITQHKYSSRKGKVNRIKPAEEK
jgi:hypothetical protein